MPASYDDAVTELYRAPHDAFVIERKRLAGELKAAGDKEGAAKLTKLHRPPVSVWAVNQLWWHDRRDLEAMLETAERLRAGDLGAGPAHREAIGKLRARASAILANAGHGASEATLRRVTTTLSAIAAAGGFAPDAPGALTTDRDPPGFETMSLAAAATAAPAAEHRPATKPAHGKGHGKHAGAAAGATEPEDEADATEGADADGAGAGDADSAHHAAAARLREAAQEQHRRAAEAAERAEAARERAEAAAERRRLEEQAARHKAQRERVEAALRTAHGEVERLQRDLEKLRDSVSAAEDRLVRAKAIAADLEAKLADLA